MIKLNTLGSNQNLVTVGEKTILFSYNTPVACNVNGRFYRTSKKWSKTTSRHINSWLAGATANEISQEELENLLYPNNFPIKLLDK